LRNRIKMLFQVIEERSPAAANLLRRATGRLHTRSISKRIAGKNNSITYKNGFLSRVLFDIAGNQNRISIADDCRLNGLTFYIRGNNNRVSIGEHCRFGPSSSIWIDDNDCELVIGEFSSFEKVSLALPESGTRIEIGERCMFAYDIDVRTGDSHSIVSAGTGERLNYGQDIHIADHVWVGAHCLILKGTCIASDSVIAAGAVVTNAFEEPGIVIGGNPAKVLKEGINWARERLPKPELPG